MNPKIIPFLLLLLIASVSCNKAPHTPLEERLQTYSQLSLEEKISPAHATATFKVTDGLQVALFAAEPDVINPTNIDVDDRGRVWVCESYNYGVPEEEQTITGGRIVILEDTDQDGKADSRKVFYQGEDVNIALGIAVLGNKVYVTRSPDMLVFTDEDGDDKPDKKEVLFTGMGNPGDHSAHALVFGPDGRFYFNMGNMGYQVNDRKGNQIIDKAGNVVQSKTGHYKGGMIFRCEPDGSNFEVLGHNFRNNYELALDSYGGIWQSDNDDDGNKSCRLNYILEYGNYGYQDEITREGWRTPRTNLELTVPQQHWHQNDPGVVPNLIVTGAGSPAGISYYEGSLLPEHLQHQPIHTDAGPNVVWSIPTESDGAGYLAKTRQLVKSMSDQWFRPVDICVAPDGSLLVADWYDPGVGGGAAADSEKGRIFRIAPDKSNYKPGYAEVKNIKTAIAALKSPNMATRYLGWTWLHAQGKEAEEALNQLWQDKNPVYRARALWLLVQINPENYVVKALDDDDPNLRITGIRAARQMGLDIVTLVKDNIDDPAPEVQRELAIALRYEQSPEAGKVWAQLAMNYPGSDRWWLEALGIGAMDNWENCFSAWLKAVGNDWNTPAGRDIIWRSRYPRAMDYLAKIIRDDNIRVYKVRRYFRAFDFHQGEDKNDILLTLINLPRIHRKRINAMVLQHLDADKININTSLAGAIEETLSELEGGLAYVNIIKQFKLTGKRNELVTQVLHGDNETAAQAAKLLFQPAFNGEDLLRQKIKLDSEEANKIIEVLPQVGKKESMDLLAEVAMNPNLPNAVRKEAITALGKSWWGEDYLLECVKKPSFPEFLQPVAAGILFNVYREKIRNEAADYLPTPGGKEGEILPPVRDLLALSGNSTKGKLVFENLCTTCHVVNGQGIGYGPELSQIGNKLPKEGLYRAIMFPNEGINYDYAGVTLEMQDGSVAMGIVESENESLVELRIMGGTTNFYDKSKIKERKPMDQSLMPTLTNSMSQEQLVDLVEYLRGLK